MAVLRFARFTVDPANVDEMLSRRTTLVAAIKEAYPALTETRLAQVDDKTWVDTWRWDSLAEAQAALEHAPSIPEAAAAFALTSDLSAHFAEIVDES